MSKINLKDFSEAELKAGLEAKRDLDKFQKKPFWIQFKIIAKQNGIPITAIIALLSGGVWQKDNIMKAINPPTEIINEQIVAHNLPETVELNTRKIEGLADSIDKLNNRLTDLAYYLKRKSYTHRNSK